MLFIGYSGVGKSTIINGLEQKILFKSNHSNNEEEEHNGKTYIEVTLKKDTEKIKMAAERINQVIKKNVRYQVFFVVKAKSKRNHIRKKDLKAIQLVLQNTTNIPSYRVIINKLSERAHKALEKKDGLKLVFPGDNKTQLESTFLLRYKENLSHAKNALCKFEDLDEFVAASHNTDAAPAKDTNNSGEDTSFFR